MLDYLNGRKSIGGYAARNTAQKLHGRQKNIATDQDQARVTMQRDKTTALSTLNKMALFMMKLVNRLMQARVAVVFVNYGTGGLNSITRRDGCLFNQIPPAIFNEDIESFKPIREVFNFNQLQSKVKNPRYMDILAENSALIFLTFTKQNGDVSTKRPSNVFHDLDEQKKFTQDQKERFECFSESIDIVSSWSDLVVITSDPTIPVQDYLVSMEGSPHLTSHYNHIASIINNVHSRSTFDKVSGSYRVKTHIKINYF